MTLAQIRRHGNIEMFSILLRLGTDNIHHSLQLRAFNALEKVADFCANGLLYFVEGDILVLIFVSLAIMMGVLQLSFCFCSLPDHMVRAKKMLMNDEVRYSTILRCFTLFCIDVSTSVNTLEKI